MLYIVEFILVVLVLIGVVLYGVFALSKLLALVLAVALAVWFVRIEGSKGLFFVGGGFGATAAVVFLVSLF